MRSARTCARRYTVIRKRRCNWWTSSRDAAHEGGNGHADRDRHHRGADHHVRRVLRGRDRNMIGLGHYLTVAAILFVTGIFGIFVNRKNVIIILMSIELMLLAVNINLVAFSAHLGDLVGQVFTLFVLTV